MKTSRERLLNYIEKKQVATVRDISLALKMTPANARHHLSILANQGSVEIVGKLVGQVRGRPYSLYRATKPARRNNVNDLTRILLNALLEGKDTQERETQMQKVALKLIKGNIPSSNLQSKRINETIQQLNQMNYNARWEAHLEGPHIILENCPFLEIVGDIPEICRMNKYILEEMLGNTVIHTAQLEPTKSGLRRCIFIMETM
jgi:predicted ArsR family transcriptional regulator